MELWMQWYETSAKTWSDVFDGSREGLVDPWGLYRQWFAGMEEARGRMFGAVRSAAPDGVGSAPASPLDPTGIMDAMGVAGAMESMDPQRMYRRWFEAATEVWQKSNQFGTSMLDLSQQWTRVLEQAGSNMMKVEGGVPKDPVEFAVKWYNATSGPLGEFVQELLEREDFLEPSSRFLQNYATFYKVFKKNSEEYLKTLQLPTRSDITRVASLVVGLEDKVDRIEEAFEDFEYGYAEPATAEAVASLEKRLDRVDRKLQPINRLGDEFGRMDRIETRLDQVEGKLDRLLAGMESLQAASNGSATAPENVAGTNGGTATDSGGVQASDAARRKAEELGVDLAEVEGTGTDGQITIGDVRRKGES
jgi:polyhydroxyalkanoic acid synthase PhaR subunit